VTCRWLEMGDFVEMELLRRVFAKC